MNTNVQQRNNVHVHGDGRITVVFSHGFGCDQSMWRYMTPLFAERYRIVTFDLVGSGGSALEAYDREKYATLQGYADDLLEIVDAFCPGPVIYIGHSVSTMIGLLATIRAPERFLAQVMVGPSPCYIDDGDYVGGFTREDIDDLLLSMDSNYLGWSSSMAPAIMGVPEQPQLGAELTSAFCRNDPDIARHFAKVTFLSDHRADLPKSSVPALILQCSDDIIAPLAVGVYMHAHMQDSRLEVIDNVGHCPHMSAPTASSVAITDFLTRTAATH
jgi:sigma-B regulation protein RsbQ